MKYSIIPNFAFEQIASEPGLVGHFEQPKMCPLRNGKPENEKKEEHSKIRPFNWMMI